ncbi:MAG: hypothetical protein RJB15_1181, partial [Pseudomonadota bacterium]
LINNIIYNEYVYLIIIDKHKPMKNIG